MLKGMLSTENPARYQLSAPGTLVKPRLAAGLHLGVATAHHLSKLHRALEEVVDAQSRVRCLGAKRLEKQYNLET